ncbi:MAG: DUF87 domain-containing protein, partial [Candidatus Gracilibacteria bacterium]
MNQNKTQTSQNVQTLSKNVEGKVFSSGDRSITETPEWLKGASENVGGKIAGADEVVQLRAQKPSSTELGENPSSVIEVTPSLEVVRKVDIDAALRMTKAGYNPRTGKWVEDETIVEKMIKAGLDPKTGRPLESKKGLMKPEVNAGNEAVLAHKELDLTKSEEKFKKNVETVEVPEEDAKISEEVSKKKTVFDNIKSIFVVNTKKHKDTVEKIDGVAVSAGSTGVKTKIDQGERRLYVEAEKIFQEGLASIKDLIAPSSMEIRYDSVRIDGVYSKTFYVFAYPRYLDANWLAPVINFDVTMDISQFIYPIDSAQIMRILKKKVAQMQSSIRINAEKGRVRDPALETALEDAEQLRTEIQRGQEKFFQFALYFTLYARSEKKLEKISKQLESLLAGKLVMTKRAQLQAEHGFNSCIPMCLDELYTIRNMNTGPLSTTFPFTSSDLTSDKGILYGINRHNDSLIIFDRFALENANSVVFAKSGAGKSYAVKLEILRLMMMGTDVIVIDPENEYEALANTVGGTYLKLSLNSDRRINPFDLPKPAEGDDSQPGDLLRSNIITLQGLLRLMLGGVTPEEEGILDKALIDVYSLKGITMTVANPAEHEPPTMEDLYQILNSMEGASSLVQRLSKFTTGSYSGIFNKPTNVNLSGGLMVFCIRDLEDALRPIAMYIVLNYIWGKVRSELK